MDFELDLEGANAEDDAEVLDDVSMALTASSYVGGGGSLEGPAPSVSCSVDDSRLDIAGKPLWACLESRELPVEELLSTIILGPEIARHPPLST